MIPAVSPEFKVASAAQVEEHRKLVLHQSAKIPNHQPHFHVRYLHLKGSLPVIDNW